MSTEVERVHSKTGGRGRERIAIIVIAICVLGGILAAGYYQEDLSLALHLHTWDTASPQKLVRDFAKNASAGDPAAATALDGTRAKPVTKEGKLTGISQMGERGPGTVSLKNLVPTGEVKQTIPRIRPVSKVFGISVEYADGHWAEFGVDRTDAGLKIVDVSEGLGDHRLPQRD